MARRIRHRYSWAMETHSIVPRGGTYKLVSTAEDGTRTVVRSFATEDDAVALLKRMQEKAGLGALGHRPEDWRF